MKYYKEEGFWASDPDLADICKQALQDELKKLRVNRLAAQEKITTGHFNISDKD